jgi:general secretion pathway protein D
MQVTKDRIRNLGTTLPTSITAGVIQGGNVLTSSNGTSSSGGTGNSFILNTGGISGVGAFAVSLPASATFALLASDSNSKVLQNPQIRVLNNEKATLRIGDRVPIATGSFQPGIVGGAGVSPLVSTQFQYLDVGVNIDITPHIHADREVTLKMALEISSVTGSQNIGGITQPVIGQRRIEHETRLADGDVNLLAGILEDTETQSLSGYPWVSKIPILKYLFAQENKERQENEIVFAITPHIVRAPETTEEDERIIEVGTGSLTELRHKSPPQTAPGAAASGDADKTQQPAGLKPVAKPGEGVAPAQTNSPSGSKAPK